MERFDVIIVGGGPAGSTCARRLQSAGLKTVLLDKRVFPRDKTCAGWVTPQVLTTLGISPSEYAAEGRTLQPITAFITGTIDGPEVRTEYAEPVSYGIRRCEFDHALLLRSGAELRLGEPVASLKYSGAEWVVNEAITAPLLIGAGGHFCPVARQLGAREVEGASVVAAQEVEFRLSPEEAAGCHVDGAAPQLFFCRDLKGYGWCFRKGDYLNVGLGRVGGGGVSSQVADFCGFLRRRGSIDFDISHRFHGHAYQLYERVQPRLFDEGVLLIGDAAGLAYPQSGEGIRPAVESALLAAEVVIASRGDYAAASLARYGERVAERFGRPRGNGLSRWLPQAWLQRLAAKLLASPRFAERVVIDKWFLHREQPLLTP